jgi:hypothetical protein
MSRWFSKGEDELEGLIRKSAPSAPRPLVDELARRAYHSRPRRPLLRKLAPIASLTAVGAVALGSVGGLSYAASLAAGVVHSTQHHVTAIGSPMPLMVQAAQVQNAAADQYGPPPSPTGQIQTVDTTTAGGIAGSVTPEGGGTTAPAPTFAVTWAADTFASTGGASAVSVLVETTPPATSTPIVGASSALIQITVTDSNGNLVHALAAPMDIKFTAPTGSSFPADYVPVISTDGTSWRSTTLLDGQTLAADQQDGYYVIRNAVGDIVEIHILTRHLTVFAVLYKGNVSVSESGRKTPQAGSGLFGDPTRNHNGAPAMKQIGTVKPVAGAKGTSVPVRFFLDEQADLRVSLIDNKGNAILLNQTGSTLRGSKLTGGKTRVLHVAILRPGTMTVALKTAAPKLQKGKTYRVRFTATDFDGHKTVQFVSFTA